MSLAGTNRMIDDKQLKTTDIYSVQRKSEIIKLAPIKMCRLTCYQLEYRVFVSGIGSHLLIACKHKLKQRLNTNCNYSHVH